MTDSSTLAAVRAVFFDMDGVIYVGQRLLPGVQAMLDYLTASGRRYLFVTNNATMTAVQFAEKLARLGLTVAPENILCSAEATAAWLANQVRLGWPAGKVIVMGQAGLRDALRSAGFELTDDPFAAAYAVAGAHFEVTYRELADAALAIRNGARFIGTNGDRTFPSERGLIPGAGSMLALLSAATDVQPIVIGKPHPPMFEIALAPRRGDDGGRPLRHRHRRRHRAGDADRSRAHRRPRPRGLCRRAAAAASGDRGSAGAIGDDEVTGDG